MRFTVLFFLFFPSFAWAIIITEVQTEGERTDDAYIKIYNTFDRDVNIEGYSLRKRSSTGSESSIRVFPKESTIKKNDYFVWASSRNEDFPLKMNADIKSKQYLSQDNSVALINKDGEVIDSLSWGSPKNPYSKPSVNNPEKGQTVLRKKENETYKQNSDNFYIYPPPSPPAKPIEFNKKRKEKERVPFLRGVILSFVMGIVVVYLKKTIENDKT